MLGLLGLIEKSWLINRKQTIDKNNQNKNVTTKNMISENNLKQRTEGPHIFFFRLLAPSIMPPCLTLEH